MRTTVEKQPDWMKQFDANVIARAPRGEFISRVRPWAESVIDDGYLQEALKDLSVPQRSAVANNVAEILAIEKFGRAPNESPYYKEDGTFVDPVVRREKRRLWLRGLKDVDQYVAMTGAISKIVQVAMAFDPLFN